jgi:hypothetical protein
MGELDDEERFSLSVLQGYIDEILQGYVRRILYAIQDGGRSLILWRNQIYFGNGYFGFPIYSLLSLIMCGLAVEIPSLIPGLICLGFALLMLVQMQHRIYQQPSPLRRCFGFIHFMRILLIGKAVPIFEEVKPNHGLEELKMLEKMLKDRIERDRAFFGKKEAVEKVIEEVEHELVQSKTKPIPIELMGVLGKVQGIVGGICRNFRLIDTVITWEDSSIAFFVTLFFILGGLLLLCIPWAFLFKWTGRVLTVVILGPQNKLIDLFFYRYIPTDDERIRKLFMERMFSA